MENVRHIPDYSERAFLLRPSPPTLRRLRQARRNLDPTRRPQRVGRLATLHATRREQVALPEKPGVYLASGQRLLAGITPPDLKQLLSLDRRIHYIAPDTSSDYAHVEVVAWSADHSSIVMRPNDNVPAEAAPWATRASIFEYFVLGKLSQALEEYRQQLQVPYLAVQPAVLSITGDVSVHYGDLNGEPLYHRVPDIRTLLDTDVWHNSFGNMRVRPFPSERRGFETEQTHPFDASTIDYLVDESCYAYTTLAPHFPALAKWIRPALLVLHKDAFLPGLQFGAYPHPDVQGDARKPIRAFVLPFPEIPTEALAGS